MIVFTKRLNDVGPIGRVLYWSTYSWCRVSRGTFRSAVRVSRHAVEWQWLDGLARDRVAIRVLFPTVTIEKEIALPAGSSEGSSVASKPTVSSSPPVKITKRSSVDQQFGDGTVSRCHAGHIHPDREVDFLRVVVEMRSIFCRAIKAAESAIVQVSRFRHESRDLVGDRAGAVDQKRLVPINL